MLVGVMYVDLKQPETKKASVPNVKFIWLLFCPPALHGRPSVPTQAIAARSSAGEK